MTVQTIGFGPMKGPDYGAADPSGVRSVSGCLSTYGAGLPTTTGRKAGDLHYDTTAAAEYVLIPVTNVLTWTATGAGGGAQFAYDSIVVPSDGTWQSQLELAHAVAGESLHVYLNGLEQRETTDWVYRDFRQAPVESNNAGGYWSNNGSANTSTDCSFDQSSQGTPYHYNVRVTGVFSQNGEGVNTKIFMSVLGGSDAAVTFRIMPTGNGYGEDINVPVGQTKGWDYYTPLAYNGIYWTAARQVARIDLIVSGGFVVNPYYPPLSSAVPGTLPGQSVECLTAMDVRVGDLVEARYAY